jgi:hypothetical protein
MKRSIAELSLLLIATALPTQAKAAELPIGQVVQQEYNGAVAESQNSGRPRAVHYADRVFALDTVKTGATGSTELRFLDDTTIQIGGDAEVRLDDFVYDPTTSIGTAKISFAVGAFRYIGGKMATEEDVRLHTPTATMVIRGTELIVYVWFGGRTEVNVISGAVEVSGCGGKKAAFATAGMQITVRPNCSTQLAAAPPLPGGLDALHLPDRRDDDNSDDGDGRSHYNDRGGRSERDSTIEPKGPANSGGSGTNGGPGPHI